MPFNDEELLQRAKSVRERAYAPYSKFQVGAALRATDGTVFEGVNVENASYGVGLCAERAAVVSAVTAGYREFDAIAIAGPPETATVPCGACRQVLNEFNPVMTVFYTAPGGAHRTTLGELLPHAFGPQNLT